MHRNSRNSGRDRGERRLLQFIPLQDSRRGLRAAVVAVALAVAQLSPAAGDGGPQCVEIFPTQNDFRPRGPMPKTVEPRGDLSHLRAADRRNINFYVRDKLQRRERVPGTVWLFPLASALFEPQLSLVLENGPCKGRCRGVAVLSRHDGNRLQRFSYGKYVVGTFSDWNWMKVGDSYEMPSSQQSFWDERGQHVVAFFDVIRAPQPFPPGSPALKFVSVDRSEAQLVDDSEAQRNFIPCLRSGISTDRPPTPSVAPDSPASRRSAPR